jgi:hypothetical protein
MLPSQFDQREFAEAMSRLAEGTSPADQPMRPGFDLQQHLEVVAESVHGRRIDDFKVALERAGFTLYHKGAIPPGCGSRHLLDPPRPLLEAQWRRPADRVYGTNLAMTEAQVCSWFESPEAFWTWMTGLVRQWRVKQAESERARKIQVAVPR